jgi:hypothetical protein
VSEVRESRRTDERFDLKAPAKRRAIAEAPHGGSEMIRWILALTPMTFALSACATPAQMHSEAQLNDVAVGCGLALGELIQDEEQKKLLLMVRNNASLEQRACVARWARRNGLKAVFVNMTFPEEPLT